MRGDKWILRGLLLLALLSLFATGCGAAKDAIDDASKVKVSGTVYNAKGKPVEGAQVKLFDLLQNKNFVIGGEIESAEGLIDPEKVANSDNTIATATTGSDGKFAIEDVTIGAFLATASGENCSVDFQGFDAETGVLNKDTLLKPSLDKGGLVFEIPRFTITCADPPENVNEDGSAEGTVEPEPQPEPTCDADDCTTLGGFCVGAVCTMPLCSDEAPCEGEAICVNGGTVDAACVTPMCSETNPCGDGLICENPGTLDAACVKTACEDDDDCGSGLLCVAGGTINAVCVAPVCTEEGDECGDEMLCHNPGTLEALCLPPVCTEDGEECGEGNVCNNPGTLDASCDEPVCDDNDDCEDDLLCVNPGTVNAQCIAAVCYSNDDCEAGTLCREGGTLLAMCVPPVCTEDQDCDEGAFCVSGGTLDAICVFPACNTHEDCGEGLYCVDPGTLGATCVTPACVSDDDCVDSFCGVNDETGLPECQPPDPNEILPPVTPDPTWTSFKVLKNDGAELVDATTENKTVSNQLVQANSIVRVYGEYTGEQTSAFVMVQTGSSACGEGMEPKIDYIEVPIIDGKLNGGKGDFLEVYLYGGYMKVQLSTSNINGEGERSNVVEFGEACLAPENPLTVILSWNVPDDPSMRADVDLHAWNAAEEQVYYARKVRPWGQLDVDDRKGPGPEVFTVTPSGGNVGPITIKVRYFAGRISPVQCKVRVIHWNGSNITDRSYEFELVNPRDIFEVGVFELVD